MARDAAGNWIGLGVGDVDNPDTPRNAPNWRAIELLSQKLHDKFQWVRDTGFIAGPAYTEATATIVEEFCYRVSLPVIRDAQGFAVTYLKVRSRLGSYPPPAPNLPIMFTVEGHLSDMFRGPVADTATRLEADGLCRHQPIGYNNGALPFDNDDGVRELARLVGSYAMDNGVPFPAGTPWALGFYSQGAIVGFDFYVDYLLPGKPLHWRLADLVGVLTYALPCRETGSVADWARPWVIGAEDTHGLDPARRFGLPGFPATPPNWVDVWRTGDIFAESKDDRSSQIKASVYQAVARRDFFSHPHALAAQVGDLFETPASQVVGIVQAIISGITFLADRDPHYAPFEIEGGIAWMRERLVNT
ncbi:peptidoglycan-binding protein [Mycobacterium spongiae]|uniref:Peptidoglycan-binding protein n=1 Tax=Mycobacterium spongiae TaxID=886343 RepID=A0A975JYJ4_9MYCO|nr:peptidoglycan-binding protein [Mycobacterium spongiae]QUR68072.1 peptidoglycan-binding protein [Mycobacterium spongiae]